jgi:hypothetical protein
LTAADDGLLSATAGSSSEISMTIPRAAGMPRHVAAGGVYRSRARIT